MIKICRVGFIRRAVLAALLFSAFSGLVSSCSHIDDDRLPPAPVHISFAGVGDWNLYGVSGALDTRRFIKPDVPSNFPWTALTYTGFGGILLVSDVNSQPLAYDLACPYECKNDVRINVVDNSYAECPKCHSTYDIFMNLGTPLSGPAAERGYGLTRYSVYPGAQGEYMVVTR